MINDKYCFHASLNLKFIKNKAHIYNYLNSVKYRSVNLAHMNAKEAGIANVKLGRMKQALRVTIKRAAPALLVALITNRKKMT